MARNGDDRFEQSEPTEIHTLPPGQSEERLISWKEIAAHFRRQVRTVQRWEQEEGLPVHRHNHKGRASIYAFKSELDAWWTTHGPKNGQPGDRVVHREVPLSRSRMDRRTIVWFAAIVILLTAIVAIVWLLFRPLPVSPSAELKGTRFFAGSLADGHDPIVVPLPAKPWRAAINPRGNELYIVSQAPSALAILDTATLRITATVPLAPIPFTVRVSPNGREILVGHYGGDVTVVQADSHDVTTLPVGSPVTDIAITPDGERLYVAMERGGLKRVSLATREQKRLAVVPCPVKLAITPDGNRLYVAYQCGGPGGRPGHDTIEAYELPSERPAAVIGGFPNVGGELRVSPDGAYLWAFSGEACAGPPYDGIGCPGVGSVINLVRIQNNSPVRTLLVPGRLDGFFDHGARAVFTSASSIEVFDTVSFFTRETFPISQAVATITSPDERRAYVVQEKSLAVFEMGHACDPPENGLVNFWPADGNPNDVHRGYNGILRGDTRFAPGRIGQAFLFDGADDYVIATDHTAIESGAFAAAAWVKFNSLGEHLPTGQTEEKPMSILARVASSEPHWGWQIAKTKTGHFLFYNGERSMAECLASGRGVLSRTRAIAGKWFHVTGVQDHDSIAIYVNGNLEAKRPLVLPDMPTDGYDLSIGGNEVESAFLNGLVDEVALYRAALSPAQIASLFQAGKHPGP